MIPSVEVGALKVELVVTDPILVQVSGAPVGLLCHWYVRKPPSDAFGEVAVTLSCVVPLGGFTVTVMLCGGDEMVGEPAWVWAVTSIVMVLCSDMVGSVVEVARTTIVYVPAGTLLATCNSREELKVMPV